MKSDKNSTIMSTEAALWDGEMQLPGMLALKAEEVLFLASGFSESHLNLRIPISSIHKVEEYLVFDLARNGLRIENRDGKYDLFVLEDVHTFKVALLREIAKVVNK